MKQNFKMAMSSSDKDTHISKTMSYILRHGAEKEKIPITKGALKIISFVKLSTIMNVSLVV